MRRAFHCLLVTAGLAAPLCRPLATFTTETQHDARLLACYPGVTPRGHAPDDSCWCPAREIPLKAAASSPSERDACPLAPVPVLGAGGHHAGQGAALLPVPCPGHSLASPPASCRVLGPSWGARRSRRGAAEACSEGCFSYRRDWLSGPRCVFAEELPACTVGPAHRPRPPFRRAPLNLHAALRPHSQGTNSPLVVFFSPESHWGAVSTQFSCLRALSSSVTVSEPPAPAFAGVRTRGALTGAV